MSAKTAVSVLKEFCDKLKLPAPQYEAVKSENDSQMFIVVVSAVGFMAKGTARSKIDAKHLASEQLLEILMQHDSYRDKIGPKSYVTKSNKDIDAKKNSTIQNNDAVGALVTICLNRQLQSPVFEVVSIAGQDHRREFTFGCRVGHDECVGLALTKKEAKQIAAKNMLDLLEEKFRDNESTSGDSLESGTIPWVIPLLEIPSVQEVLEEYRRLKKPYIKPVTDGLRYRKNFFLKLPESNKREAQRILTVGDSLSPIDVVDQAFKALNINYTVERVTGNKLRFALINCDFDCVFFEKNHELFPKVIHYLKTMLNAQNVEEAIGL